MSGGADNLNGDLGSYITGADRKNFSMKQHVFVVFYFMVCALNMFPIGKQIAIMFLVGKQKEAAVIKSWKHKGLQKLYLKDDPSGVQANDVERLKLRLLVLDEAVSTDDFKQYPGFKFHPLKGNKQNLYAITVRANWRITFEFKDGDAYILNLEDYH